MKPLSVQQIRQAVSGRALSSIPATAPLISEVCTDTRAISPGCLFIALKGERFNAHTFLPQAAAGGAVAALVEEEPEVKLPNVHLIAVPDTRAALGKLATYVRRQMTSKVIAVAGSNGKTSTKHLINAALCNKLMGSISPKSFNNDIGVPLTIFPADPRQDYLVLEIGTNHPGEIKKLSDMSLPDIAVITSISAEHLEGLGDLMGVRRENASIISGMNPNGMLVVNGDDADLLDAVAAYPGRKVTFGFGTHNDLFATDIECTEDGTRFRLNNSRTEVFVPMLGRHTASNALAAIAVARRFGLTEEMVLQGLAVAQGAEMRLQLERVRDLMLLNDAYNANPASMKAALDTLVALPRHGGRRLAILGDMRELGQSSDRFHVELGEYAANCALDGLICIGPKSKLLAEAAQRVGMATDQIAHFPDAQAAAKDVPGWLQAHDVVLLKASRGIHLEVVAEAIKKKQLASMHRVAS